MEIEISIVVPVYNSENSLQELNQQVSEALQHQQYELVLVNDKSKDKSWDKIVELSKINKHIKGISLKKNAGQDNAIMAGLSFAGGSYVVVMDDDLQHSPADILKLYEKCKTGYDICYGLFLKKKQSIWKNIGSKFNEYLSEIFLKKPKGLYLSPFKVIHRDLVKEITQYKGPFPYLDGIVLSLTSNITQIELTHHKRQVGKGNYNLFKSVSVFLKHITGYSLYPLRIATIIGFTAAAVSILLGVYYLIDYLTNAAHVEGWITLVLLIVFFNGLILMCIGLIGEYIGRIYLTITSKRQYLIDKTINS
ncbi:MAG TPA: glycosyltransferase family 2 protein [Cyclobacteriaceae bacterium]|nr:glycosyltransferase family 2 protein [Cyclobacteriaceae bacterium]